MSRRRYLTTPIYYASGEPHIGHAYTTILTDVLARFHRQTGAEVRFLTGTDEHGPKIAEEAARRGLTPIELCDRMAGRFREAWGELDISFDRFIRTTEADHIAVVTAFLQRLHDQGHIYKDRYLGWYCIHEERYWTEKDLGPGETCPDCGRPVRQIEEVNYFFRMSAFQERLVRHIEANPDWIIPAVRRNEVLGFLQQPLEDLSISRPRSRVSWGVPLPFDPEHVCYVWVDALINYVTASGAIDPDAAPDERGFGTAIESWWPADLHVMGKDILTTHAVYWPTILMACEVELPRHILAHGWWLVGETKMSKSLQNVVDPLALIATHGVDAVRWYLLREMPTGSDASYTPERFLTRYDELSNVLGNLASRVTSMIARYRDGALPDAAGQGLAAETGEALRRYRDFMNGLRLHRALGGAMELARHANRYVEEREPWVQARDPERAPDLDETLVSLARCLTVLAALLEPVMPAKMGVLAGTLGLARVPTLDRALDAPLAGRAVTRGEPLFPRVRLPSA